MVTAAWDTSNLVALYKDGKQCTSCCDGLPDPNEMETPVCVYCDPQPIKVRLILSNFVDAGATVCAKAVGTGYYGLYPTGIEDLLNGSHILDHDSGCIYKKSIEIDYTWVRHFGDLCEDEAPEDKHEILLELKVTAIPGKAEIWIALEDFWQGVFHADIILDGPVSCFVGIEGVTVDNTYIGGPCGVLGIGLASGTAEIEI